MIGGAHMRVGGNMRSLIHLVNQTPLVSRSDGLSKVQHQFSCNSCAADETEAPPNWGRAQTSKTKKPPTTHTHTLVLLYNKMAASRGASLVFLLVRCIRVVLVCAHTIVVLLWSLTFVGVLR